MAFTATPQDGSSPTPIPMSSAVPDGTNTPLAIEGGPSVTTGGNTLVPVSMYVKDGNDIAQGTSTDAANANSVIGQLKQIKTNTTLGSATSANSLPMVMASDQPPIGVIESCIVSTVNSSTATLTANSVFTGTSESALPFSALSVEVFSDQASAAGGLSVQQSQNGTNWDVVDAFSVLASTAFNTTVNLVAQFFRVVYTNGATGQATFRLQIIKQPVDVVLPRTLTVLGNLKAALQEVNGAALSLGQTTMAASLPVTLASNQPTQNVAITAAIPTGANTIGAVTQASGPWTNNITQVAGSAITLGSKTSANSFPVVIASDQGSMPMSIQATSGTALAADQTNTELRVSTYGKNSTAGDTALQVDSDGSQYVDLRRVAGSTLSVSNPVITESSILNAIRNGQAYSATTGRFSAPGVGAFGLALYNPAASGKNILIYSLRNFNSNGGAVHQVNIGTTDFALGTAITPINAKIGAAASVATLSYAATSVSVTGTAYDAVDGATNAMNEVFPAGSGLYFPSGAANSICIYINLGAAGIIGATMRWIEL